jgi:hypothetical protein
MAAGRGGGVLPPGYTQLNYIEKQANLGYIDIPLVPSSELSTLNLRAEIDFMPKNFASIVNYATIIGYNNNFQAAYNAAGKASVGNAYSTNAFFAENVKCHVTAELKYSGGKYFVDGADTGLLRVYRYSTGTVQLFAATSTQFNAQGRLYSVKIYDIQDNLVYDYVPCADPDGYYGIYDVVNGQFYCDRENQANFTGG